MALEFPEPQTQLHKLASAIETRLRLAFPATIFDFCHMPPIPSSTEWERLTRRKPCLGLAWAGLVPDDRAGRLFTGRAKWIIYLVVDNAQTDARFFGDNRGIGLIGMVTAATYLLHGWTLDDVGTTYATSIESLTKEEWGNDTTAIAGIELTTPLIPDGGIADTAERDDLIRIGASWLANGATGPTDLITVGS